MYEVVVTVDVVGGLRTAVWVGATITAAGAFIALALKTTPSAAAPGAVDSQGTRVD